MNPAVATVVVAVVGVIGGLAGSALSTWMNRGREDKRDDVDFTDKLTGVSNSLLDRMNTEVSRLDDKCNKCQTALDAANDRLEAHNGWLEAHNGWLRVRDEATYDLLEFLETFIAPLLDDEQEAAMHAASLRMREAMVRDH